ncbi:MAG: hypothetical protein GF364_15680 [Candidatus Lokiarchaeota archaeon]|nr:hypothetical protein [Candidatus Lokiarchaeota archaeon]
MKIKKILFKINYQYQLSKNNWKTSYRTFNILTKKILFNKYYRNNYDANTVEFALTTTRDKLYGKNSKELNILKLNFDKDLRKYFELKPFKKRFEELLSNEMIYIKPEINFSNILLFTTVRIFIGPLKSRYIKLLIDYFSFLPYSEILLTEYVEKSIITKETKWNQGILVNLKIPASLIEELYFSIKNTLQFFKNVEFEFIQNIIDIKPTEFSEDRNCCIINPFEAHHYRDNQWLRIPYFTQKGPIDYFERKNLI